MLSACATGRRTVGVVQGLPLIDQAALGGWATGASNAPAILWRRLVLCKYDRPVVGSPDVATQAVVAAEGSRKGLAEGPCSTCLSGVAHPSANGTRGARKAHVAVAERRCHPQDRDKRGRMCHPVRRDWLLCFQRPFAAAPYVQLHHEFPVAFGSGHSTSSAFLETSFGGPLGLW